jgi:hypothetical protein
LTLEPLEDRRLPAVTLWTGANTLQDTNWSDPANWSNGVPGAGDTAEFNSDSAYTQFSTVDKPFTIQGLLITSNAGGIMFVNAPLVLTGTSEWDAITIQLSSASGGNVTNNGTISSTNGVGMAGNGTFTNNGTLIRQGTTGDLGVGGYDNGQGLSVKLDNTSTGVIDLQSDSGFTSGNGYVANAGTIKKTGGTGTSTVFVSMKNSGTIDAESGMIRFIGVDSSDTGTSFAQVDTNGMFKTAKGAAIELADNGYGPFVENGTFNATGSGTILLDSGTLDAGPAGATFNVAGTVTFSWNNSSIDVPTGATLTYNGPLSINGSGFASLGGGGTFLENGTITVSATDGLALNDGGPTNTTLDIASGSTLDFQSDAGIFINCCGERQESFVNAGTIEKTGGTGTSSLSVPLSNTGTIGVYTGTLAVNNQANSTFTNSGSLVIAAGSVLQVSNNYTQTATGSLQPILAGATSFGQLQVSGQATLDGALKVSTANNFSPTAGQSFPVLTAGSAGGTFAALSGLSFANGVSLNPVYSSSGVVLQASVTPSLLTAAGQDVSATAGQPFRGVVAVVTDTFPNVHAGDLRATIDWGDRQTSSGTFLIGFSAGTFAVTGSHTYSQGGSYAVSVTVLDTASSQSATAHGTATVPGSQLPPQTPRGITAQLVPVKVRRKKWRLMVDVFFADTGAKKREFPSPFQKPGFQNIRVGVRAGTGGGVPDQVVVTARKGKRTVTAVFPG